MKIKLIANELTDGEIDFVSLVKHGANRSPFKIIKMEDLPEGTTMDTLKDKFTALFGDEKPEVAAFYVQTEFAKEYEVKFKAAGFTTNDPIKKGEFTVYPQAGYDESKDGALITVDNKCGIALDRVVKDFSSFPSSEDFQENLGASAFFPGLHHSFEALVESVWNTLNKADSLDDAAPKIDKNLMAFRKHVNALVRNMPSSVIKMEYEGLANDLGGSKVGSSDTDTLGKGNGDMTEKIKEALGGDLEGLNDTIKKDEAALAAASTKIEETVDAGAADKSVVKYLDAAGKEITKDKYTELQKAAGVDTSGDAEKIAKASPGDPVVLSTSDSGEVARDEGLPAGWREVQKTVKKFIDGAFTEITARFAVNDETKEEVFLGYVTKEEKETAADKDELETALGVAPTNGKDDPYLAGLNLIGKGMNKMVDLLEKQGERLDKVIETNEEAVKKADDVTLVTEHGYDLDESFGTLEHRDVKKSDGPQEGIWKGLSPELDHLEARFREKNGLDS